MLVDAGLLKVTATRRVRAIEERFYGRTAHTIVFPDARSTAICRSSPTPALRPTCPTGDSAAGGFTLRHARIPAELAQEFTRRVMDLATEFTRLPRGGYANTRSTPASSQPTVPSPPRTRNERRPQ